MYNRIDAPVSGKQPVTDYNRWRLLVNDGGRHTWHYLETDEECEKWPMNDVDKFWMGIPLVGLSFVHSFETMLTSESLYLNHVSGWSGNQRW